MQTSSKKSTRRILLDGFNRVLDPIGLSLIRNHVLPAGQQQHVADFEALLAERDGELHGPGTLQSEAAFVDYCKCRISTSYAQLLQDLFALYVLGSKRNGFFVEFGATDGVSLSNTCLLEKAYGWKGILAEPARGWSESLRANRDCNISTDCVWRTSGDTLVFNETKSQVFSTIDEFSSGDQHSSTRTDGDRYEVQTVSLQRLLENFDAPRVIDYLSVDTEGSEFEILEAFEFSSYQINVITVEHNFTDKREQIYRLLSAKGFIRMYENLSRWDDWYVNRLIAKV